MNNELSNKLYNMSFLSACLIVVLHAPIDFDVLPSWFVSYVTFGICKIAVPYFFLASGFFLMRKYEGTPVLWWSVYKSILGKRFVSLAIPYLIFETVASAIKGEWGYGLNLFDFPAYHLLWYIRTLLLFMVASIFLAYMIRKSKILSVCFMVFLLAFACLWHPISKLCCAGVKQLIDVTLRPFGLLMFTFGMWMGFYYNKLLLSQFIKYFSLIGVAFLLVWSFENNVFEYIGILCLMLGVIGLVGCKKWPTLLCRNSFAIYLLHGLIIYGIRLLRSRLGFASQTQTVLGALFISMFTIVSSIAIAEFLRKNVPQIHRVLFGGR